MPVTVQCEGGLPLDETKISLLWDAVMSDRDQADDIVSVRCVGEAEMKKLNNKYRGDYNAHHCQ